MTLRLMMGLLLCSLFGNAQPLKPLDPGDTLPEPFLSYIHAGTSPGVAHSDVRGKIILLDFWATWCTSCLQHFPHLDSLQQRFGSNLLVLLVNAYNTGDNHVKITALFSKLAQKRGRAFRLASLENDTILCALFPHALLPHYVWIDGSGKVLATTDAEPVTAVNIAALIAGKKMTLPLKRDALAYEARKPLLEEGNGGTATSLMFRSIMTGYLEGLGSGARRSRDSNTLKICYLNQSILALYQVALRFPGNRVVLEVKDSGRILHTASPAPDWKKNLYCYEMTLPLRAPETLVNQQLLQDLDRWLGLQGRLERRRMDCWVLVRIGRNACPPPGKESGEGTQWYSKEHPLTLLHHQPLSRLVAALNNQPAGRWPKTIFLDESDCTQPVDLRIAAPLDDVPALQKELRRYGLDLVRAQREVEVFVLREAAEGTSPPFSDLQKIGQSLLPVKGQ